MTNNRTKPAGFTLLELMVVIAVMAVLLGLTVPAFQGLGRGSRARTTAFQLNNAMSLARQLAITTRQDVHVLFPDSAVNYPAGSENLAYSAFAVYGVRDRYVGEWRKLPPGVVFHDTYKPSADKVASEPFNVFLQTGTNYLKYVAFPAITSPTQGMMALTFRADGALAHAGFNRKGAFITEGWLNTTPTLAPGFRPGSTIYGLEIRPESGQTRTREYNP